MFKKWICGCIALVWCFTAYSQVVAPVVPLEKLLHLKQHVTINWRDNTMLFADTPFNRFPQELLKTTNGLSLFVNGSGRLYQLTDSGANIRVQRIDSTFYSGYNLGSFPFVYHDSIYNLGGYGIWRINGQLRVYVPQAHSWDIVPLNNEIPVLMQEENHNMLWYNEQEERLYIAYSIIRNQAVKHPGINESSFDYTVRFLDLKTKDWHVAGALNNYFKDKVAMLRNIAFTPWGQLVTLGDKLLLIDYTNNRLLCIQEGAERAIRPVLFQYPSNNLYYCIDSTLYFGNIAENRLSSLQLHYSDFTDGDMAVYTPVKSPAFIIMEWVAGVLVLSLVVFAVWKIRKQNKTVKHIVVASDITEIPPEEEVIASAKISGIKTIPTAKPLIYFDEKELQVIQLILTNNRQSLPTTIDDVNAVLGLSKKSNNAQKSNRSKVLKSINTKYSIWQNTTGKLIESKPVEADRRTFIYYISPDKEAIVATLLDIPT